LEKHPRYWSIINIRPGAPVSHAASRHVASTHTARGDVQRVSSCKKGNDAFAGADLLALPSTRKEQALLRALQRPEFNIRGVRRTDLKLHVPQLSLSALSRQLHRLRLRGIIKRATGTFRYYLTRLGRAATAACCRITECILVPALAEHPTLLQNRQD